MEFYKGQDKFYVLVDCITLGFKDRKLQLLITKCKSESNQEQYLLPGRFMRSSETLDDAGKHVFHEYTGIKTAYMEQTGVYCDKPRTDDGERIISVAYRVLINPLEVGVHPKRRQDVEWVDVHALGEMALNHNRLVHDAMKFLRQKASSLPLAFNMLPEMFTLPNLQLLYESIYGKVFDKRNFRKRLLDMDILDKHDEKDKSSSKRGAYYYSFSEDKYELLCSKGHSFHLK
jgi:hypothetical protein